MSLSEGQGRRIGYLKEHQGQNKVGQIQGSQRLRQPDNSQTRPLIQRAERVQELWAK